MALTYNCVFDVILPLKNASVVALISDMFSCVALQAVMDIRERLDYMKCNAGVMRPSKVSNGIKPWP